MTKNSNIEWTHHTFNPWRGCSKVSQGCKHCYADTMSHRNPAVLGIWGKNGSRPIAAESYWKQPLAWNKAAEKAGERHRVFCASLADVFEGPETMPSDAVEAVNAARARLFDLIKATPHLDWLLLTKRPENIAAMLPADWGSGYANVWLGTSVENQEVADHRIPILTEVPATVRFLSCEPLLGPLDIEELLTLEYYVPESQLEHFADSGARYEQLIHWIIVGGESGTDARPMNPRWVRGILNQCIESDVAFFFKQWGEWFPWSEGTGPTPDGRPVGFFTNADAWHEGKINTFRQSMIRIGKKAAGRLLDGDTWDELPY